MKSKTVGLIKLIASIVLILLFHYFYNDFLNLIGIRLTGLSLEIAGLIKYFLLSAIVFCMYYRTIRISRGRYNKSILSSLLYSFVCLVFLVAITVIVHQVMKSIGKPISYTFTNYFKTAISASFIIKLITEVILIPFILCVVFPLGFSQAFKNGMVAAILAGVSYGLIYGILNHLGLESILVSAITPAVIMAFLTGLYKNINNIWTVIVTYSCYVMFGIFVLNYIQ